MKYWEKTIDYYNRNSKDYYESTVHLDMGDFYKSFLKFIPEKGKILDAGCGSGRDSLFFHRHGYKVTAFDASKELVRLSSKLTGLKVLNLRFDEISFEQEFDGIWACASLLHVPRNMMDDVMARLINSLKMHGVLYASFKYGNKEEEQGGRFYNYLDELSLPLLLERHPGTSVISTWQSSGVRKDSGDQIWFNILFRRILPEKK